MRPKLAAVLAGLIAAGTVFAVLRSERLGAGARDDERPFPAVSARAVTALSIIDRGREIRLERGGDGWRLVDPVEDAADPRRIDEALAALARIELGSEPVASDRGAWPRYEVAEDEILSAVITQGDTTFPALHLGRSGFARVGDDARIYEVPEFRRDVLSRELAEWRDLAVLDLEDGEVMGIEVIDAAGRRARADRAPSAMVESARSVSPEAWMLTAGANYAEPFDPAVPAALVRYLLALRGAGVAEGPQAREALEKPVLRIRLYAEDDVRELVVGGRIGTKTALGSADSGRVWLLSHPQARQLARGPRQWRHKDVLAAEPGDIVALEVEQGERRLRAIRGERWRLEHPSGAILDARAAEDYTRGFAPLIADEVADPSTEMPGGAASLHLELRDGHTVSLKVGERDDGTVVVASSERRDLLLIHRQRAQTLLTDAFALIRAEGRARARGDRQDSPR